MVRRAALVITAVLSSVLVATPAVAHQWLVYAQDGHFSEMTRVSTVGGMTVYRLPFWHYTTPLMAKPRQAEAARRWVLLGTFLDKHLPAKVAA